MCSEVQKFTIYSTSQLRKIESCSVTMALYEEGVRTTIYENSRFSEITLPSPCFAAVKCLHVERFVWGEGGLYRVFCFMCPCCAPQRPVAPRLVPWPIHLNVGTNDNIQWLSTQYMPSFEPVFRFEGGVPPDVLSLCRPFPFNSLQP